MSVLYVIVLCIFFSYAAADTPANCTYEDIRGVWNFYEGERSGSNDIDCTNFDGPIVNTLKIELLFPNVAVDELGNKGYWTIVYNQGFEVVINYRKFFAFSKYTDDGHGNVTSYCDSILAGWSHDVLGKNWACYTGKKVAPTSGIKVHYEKRLVEGAIFRQDKNFIRQINKVQKSWVATAYPELEGLPVATILNRNGGIKSRIHRSPKIGFGASEVSKSLLSRWPEQFDWRDVNGVNYVSPVRNQGSCGSCFAFSSMGMLESRLRIATNNSVQVTFAPQDVVSCSEYSQGCEGGFPYLVAGKYAQDFGVVPEDCNPYTGKDGKCSEKECKRYYVADYKYIGGFYGACNEDLMKLELVANGPIVVSFEVYPDFQQYKGGIYHYTGLQSGFNPFLITNHAVLAVGYGTEPKTGEKFWIVKNSWGEGWGENGFFRIRRGTDECNIESIAVAAKIIP
ncbi:LOW QUALITY PROTEIN: dipeptidyl peptidase 1-like [Uloborus diversus]|uniref:LOW QUALITY PROTEIN: dipeptidyl peptidase 1-like n=1 Tax=Uloborus diversus TaxID=327109 RepID=UPI002409204A|nr:LOW QUALITY PROTEIN: dipeptidyl peptidase 1-like [Uloborus diversus]